ncbi:hypothetical protein DFAR_620009 [Desulfarculales bacterium]
MKPNYRASFAITRKPFGSDPAPKGIMQAAEILGVAKRFEYAIRLGALALVTGDVGSGKVTALRWATSRPHPSEHQIIWVTASQGFILELYRQICVELEVDTASFSGAVLTKLIKKQVLEFAQNAKKPSSSSMKPTSSGFKSWPSCTPSLSFREAPSQSCPSSWPARTTSATSSYTGPPCP